MTPEENDRYARQIRLPQVGEQGQIRLAASRVLVIGMGGLGSPVAMYLTAAGVGHLVISDYDRVESSNLQRQIAHGHTDIGELKAASASRTLTQLNPAVRVDALDYEVEGQELIEQAERANVIVDCTDNFPSRFELNRVSLQTNTPLVSGAAIRWEGQVATFIPSDPTSPCYQCLYSEEGEENDSCIENGVLAPVAGLIGTSQALQAIKVILNLGDQLSGSLLLVDAMDLSFRKVKIGKDSKCPICN